MFAKNMIERPELIGCVVRKCNGTLFTNGRLHDTVIGYAVSELTERTGFMLDGGGVIECWRCELVGGYQQNPEIEHFNYGEFVARYYAQINGNNDNVGVNEDE